MLFEIYLLYLYQIKNDNIITKGFFMKKKANIYLKIKRQTMLEAGAYDGRFRTRTVEDKRKKMNKNLCRSYKYNFQTN